MQISEFRESLKVQNVKVLSHEQVGDRLTVVFTVPNSVLALPEKLQRASFDEALAGYGQKAFGRFEALLGLFAESWELTYSEWDIESPNVTRIKAQFDLRNGLNKKENPPTQRKAMNLKAKAAVHLQTISVASWLFGLAGLIVLHGTVSIWVGVPLLAILMAVGNVYLTYFRPFAIYRTFKTTGDLKQEVWHVCYLAFDNTYEKQVFLTRSFWMTHQTAIDLIGLFLVSVVPPLPKKLLEKYSNWAWQEQASESHKRPLK